MITNARQIYYPTKHYPSSMYLYVHVCLYVYTHMYKHIYTYTSFCIISPHTCILFVHLINSHVYIQFCSVIALIHFICITTLTHTCAHTKTIVLSFIINLRKSLYTNSLLHFDLYFYVTTTRGTPISPLALSWIFYTADSSSPSFLKMFAIVNLERAWTYNSSFWCRQMWYIYNQDLWHCSDMLITSL